MSLDSSIAPSFVGRFALLLFRPLISHFSELCHSVVLLKLNA